MSTTLPFLTSRTVALPVDFLPALSGAPRSEPPAAVVENLRDAGYAAGGALFDSFSTWLAEHGEHSAESLPEDRFATLVSEYFDSTGWGSLKLSQLSDAVMAIDAAEWAESVAGGDRSQPRCHVSTGLFAGFFGRLADAPLAVIEVECRSSGHSTCRFLVGSVDVLQYVHEAMARGIPYDRAATSAS